MNINFFLKILVPYTKVIQHYIYLVLILLQL